MCLWISHEHQSTKIITQCFMLLWQFDGILDRNQLIIFIDGFRTIIGFFVDIFAVEEMVSLDIRLQKIDLMTASYSDVHQKN